MAKVTISIEDLENAPGEPDRQISIHVDSDPPVTEITDPNTMTAAQDAAGLMVRLFDRYQETVSAMLEMADKTPIFFGSGNKNRQVH